MNQRFFAMNAISLMALFEKYRVEKVRVTPGRKTTLYCNFGKNPYRAVALQRDIQCMCIERQVVFHCRVVRLSDLKPQGLLSFQELLQETLFAMPG